MKRIPLTQGKFASVDDEDYDWLMQWKWHALRAVNGRWYARTGSGTGNYMHQYIIGIAKGQDTDHLNHNGLDNRITNLRQCSRSQNAQNSRRKPKGTSRFVGVSWNKEKSKWGAYIMKNRTKVFLGYFVNETDAAQSYNTEAKNLYGNNAFVNERTNT